MEQIEETGFRRVLGEEKLPEIRDYSAITSFKLYCLSTGTQYYCYYGKTTQQPRRTPVDWCLCFSADPSEKRTGFSRFHGKVGVKEIRKLLYLCQDLLKVLKSSLKMQSSLVLMFFSNNTSHK